MKKILLMGLMIIMTMFLVACETDRQVAMPKISGEELSMTAEELDALLSETDYDGSNYLTTLIYLDMNMELNVSSGNQTSKTSMNMNVRGTQGVSGSGSSLELVADMALNTKIRVTANNENYTSVDIGGSLGLYYTEGTAYANLDLGFKANLMGQTNDNVYESKTYRDIPFNQIYQEFASAAGIADQTEASTSFADVINANANTNFKVYQDDDRYSIVYQFNQAKLLEQLEMADLTGAGVSFGNFSGSKGEFILIIEDGKVVDAGVNINIDLSITVNQSGVTGTGSVKMSIQARYSTAEADYPSLPDDLDSYTLDESNNFGFPSL